MIRKLIVFGCVAVVALTSTAALGAPAGAVKVKLAGIQRGAIIEGAVTFKAEATSAAGIKKLQISINGSVVATVEPSNLRQDVELPYDWATMFADGSAEPAPNGEYAIEAVAVANGNADERVVARVIVDNPAAMPRDVVAVPTDGGVELSWSPNAEPDLLGYRVERMISGEFAVVGQTSAISYMDAVDPGEHSYRIVAVRHSAARSAGRPSLPSSEVTVSVAAPATNARGKPRFGIGATRPGGSGAGFQIESGSFAPRGLPSGAALPGSVGLPDLPTTDSAPEWGSYEETLPYDIPEGGIPLSASQREQATTWKLLPSDGLRWVALGSLCLALAALLRLLARRLDAIAGPPELKL